MQLGEKTCKEIDTRKLYFINFFIFYIAVTWYVCNILSLTDCFLGYQ